MIVAKSLRAPAAACVRSRRCSAQPAHICDLRSVSASVPARASTVWIPGWASLGSGNKCNSFWLFDFDVALHFYWRRCARLHSGQILLLTLHLQPKSLHPKGSVRPSGLPCIRFIRKSSFGAQGICKKAGLSGVQVDVQQFVMA